MTEGNGDVRRYTLPLIVQERAMVRGTCQERYDARARGPSCSSA
jgi:hypothetical protein